MWGAESFSGSKRWISSVTFIGNPPLESCVLQPAIHDRQSVDSFLGRKPSDYDRFVSQLSSLGRGVDQTVFEPVRIIALGIISPRMSAPALLTRECRNRGRLGRIDQVSQFDSLHQL